MNYGRVWAAACAGAIGASASAQVTITFDNLWRGAVVTDQYEGVVFSSVYGEVNRTREGDLGSSLPYYICTTTVGDYGGNCLQPTFVDFLVPVINLQFTGVGINGHGVVATVDVYGPDGYLGRAFVLGQGDVFTPVVVSLREFSPITRIEIANITDLGGIGWDDFRFDPLSADGDGGRTDPGNVWDQFTYFPPPGRPLLRMAGSCGDLMSALIDHATPERPVALLYGQRRGATYVPHGVRCAGVRLGIEGGVRRVGVATADEDGRAAFSGYVPDSMCGGVMQALDLYTCRGSNLEAI